MRPGLFVATISENYYLNHIHSRNELNFKVKNV